MRVKQLIKKQNNKSMINDMMQSNMKKNKKLRKQNRLKKRLRNGQMSRNNSIKDEKKVFKKWK